MGSGCQKVAVTIAAPAWSVTMLQAVQQIKYIKIDETFADYLLNSHPFFLVVRVLDIFKARDQPGKRKKSSISLKGICSSRIIKSSSL